MSDRVEVVDGRRGSFFMLYTTALKQIRLQPGPPRQPRALGLYVLFCQLGNEQRNDHGPERQRNLIATTYKTLIAATGLSRTGVKQNLDLLERANVLTFTTQVGAHGSLPSLITLTELPGRHIQITEATALHIARSPGVDLLPSLALLSVLLELCDEQGGVCAEASRKMIANTRLGCSERSLDKWKDALEQTGILHVTRRPEASGNYAPNRWEVLEPAQGIAAASGPQSDPAQPADFPHAANGLPPRTEQTSPAQPADFPHAASGPPQCTEQTPTAQLTDSPGADFAASGPHAAPLRAHAGAIREEQQNSSPPSPSVPETPARGKQRTEDLEELLCEDLLATLQPRNGDGPRRVFEQKRGMWLRAAGEVLTRYSSEQARVAMAYMLTDPVKGSAGVTMPGFARVVDELLFRAGSEATRVQAAAQRHPGIPWGLARTRLERAIHRHGKDGREEALSELEQESPLYGAFIKSLTWHTICAQPLHYGQFQQAWEALAGQGDLAERAA
jgi:hypothetical protein